MLYLLDANVLIDANRDYYPIDRVPEFWEWLIHVGTNGQVKIPRETFEEIKAGKDALAEWAKRSDVEAALLLEEEVDPAAVRHVLDHGYAANLNDVEVEEIGKDPFLIAHCLADREGRCVVSTESSRPRRVRANRHVPDVCNDLQVRYVHTFAFLRELDFTTSWNRT